MMFYHIWTYEIKCTGFICEMGDHTKANQVVLCTNSYGTFVCETNSAATCISTEMYLPISSFLEDRSLQQVSKALQSILVKVEIWRVLTTDCP